MTDFKQFDVSYGGHSYTAEFDTDTVMRCQSAGVLELTSKPIDFAFECFFWAIQKNHPMSSRRVAREFFDNVILDEEYGLDAFIDISDEFARLYQELFISKGGQNKKKKKKFKVLTAPVIEIPKN